MSKSNNFTKTLYKISLLFLVFLHTHAWFTWPIEFLSFIPNTLLRLGLAVLALVYAQTNGIRLHFNYKIWIGTICFLIASNIPFVSFGEMLAQIVLFIPIAVLICDNVNAKEHLRFISVCLSFVLIPGFFLYVLKLFGYFGFWGIPIQYGDLNVNATYTFMNYGFMLVRTWEAADIRFTSIFLEPGYMGTLVSFMLYANSYNFKKWYNIVLLVALFFSFSLAGYVVTFVGYILYCVSIKKNISHLLGFGFLMVIIFLASQEYNNGNNMINELIVERLEFDEDKGIKGNDRFKGDTDWIYEKSIRTGSFLFGDPTVKNLTGAGYKVFLVNRGIITAFLYFVFYYNIAICSKRKKFYSKSFLFIIFLTFLQAAYPSSYSWIIPYLLGTKNDEKL